MSEPVKPPDHVYALAMGAGFFLGGFLSAWSSFELAIEVVVMRRLGLSARDTSILLAGLNFGSKINIFYSLLANDPAYEEKVKKMRRLVNMAERNFFVHSFIMFRVDKLAFVRREVKDRYTAKERLFTLAEFKAHVTRFTELGMEVQQDFEVTNDDVGEYVKHMLNPVQVSEVQTFLPP